MIGGRGPFGDICVFLENAETEDLGNLGTPLEGTLFECGERTPSSLQICVQAIKSPLFSQIRYDGKLHHFVINLHPGDYEGLLHSGKVILTDGSLYACIKPVARGLDDKENINYRMLCQLREVH